MSTPAPIDEEKIPDLKLESITDGQNDREFQWSNFWTISAPSARPLIRQPLRSF
jgi:hypothetical protein